MSWAKRKIAVNLTTTVTFSFPDENTFKVEFSTKVISGKEEYKIGDKTKHKSNAAQLAAQIFYGHNKAIGHEKSSTYAKPVSRTLPIISLETFFFQSKL